MDNQHRKIAGYRELSHAEIDLINAIKSNGVNLNHVVEQVRSHLAFQHAECERMSRAENDHARHAATDEEARLAAAEPGRWISIARTHFQEGLMALTRAVAQPGTF